MGMILRISTHHHAHIPHAPDHTGRCSRSFAPPAMASSYPSRSIKSWMPWWALCSWVKA